MKTVQTTERSTPRKLADSSIVVKQPIYYLGGTLTSAAIGNVAYAVAYGLEDLFDFGERVLDEFMRLRGVADVRGSNLVDVRKSCHEFIEGMVYVKSLSKNGFDDNYPYRIKIKNLVTREVPDVMHQISFYNLDVECPCPRAYCVTTCRAPVNQREQFGDFKTLKSVPGPFIATDLCKHSWVALNHLVIFYDTADFGLFGLTEHTTGVISEFVKEVVRNGYNERKMPEYKLNEKYEMLAHELFDNAIRGRF